MILIFSYIKMIAELNRITKSSYCYSLRVCCPFCKDMHLHGGGSGDEIMLGSRMSHCGIGEYEIKNINNISVKENALQATKSSKKRLVLGSRRGRDTSQ